MFNLILIFQFFLAQPQFYQKLEEEYAQGNLTMEEKISIGENALCAPEELDTRWYTLLQENPVKVKSGTPFLVKLFQEKRKYGFKSADNHPKELQYYLDSLIFPIRVYYDNAALETKAQLVLEQAEIAWDIQINDFGFYEPPLVTPENRYRIYLGSANGAAGYTRPIGSYLETPWDDCMTYVVIEKDLPQFYMRDTVTHELSHAQQAAMDCLEPIVFWENTSTYIEVAVDSESIYGNSYMMQDFQKEPWLSLSEEKATNWYGGFIWPLFLTDYYAQDFQAGEFVADIWIRSMQESGMTENTFNYLQAIDEKLSEEYHSGLHEAFNNFSISRFFVDEHAREDFYLSLPHASVLEPVPNHYTGFYFSKEELWRPPEDEYPKYFGVNYVIVANYNEYFRDTTIKLSVYDENSWTMQAVSMDNPDKIITTEVADGSASLVIQPEEFESYLLVIANLGSEDLIPETMPRDGSSYSLEIFSTVPLPKVTKVLPETVEAGKVHDINVYGSNFQEDFSLEFFPENNIEVIDAYKMSDSQIKASISLVDTALTGYVKVSVINGDGGEDELDNALLITEPEASEKDSDWGCSNSGSSGSEQNFLFLILFFSVLLGPARKFF
ncbi:MAG: hypothetical protein ACQES9_09770 [Myxococcota bacterium]